MATKPSAGGNIYHRRQVAESSSKACWICFKPSTTVLITPDQDDWFHVCPGHLTDRKFAIAKDSEAFEKKKREDEINAEIEAIKKELAEKKAAKKSSKSKSKSKDKDKSDDAKDDSAKPSTADADVDVEEAEKEAKLRALEKEKQPAQVDGPRIFELDRSFYAMRVQKRREAELARKNRERLRNPSAFPSVPTGDLG